MRTGASLAAREKRRKSENFLCVPEGVRGLKTGLGAGREVSMVSMFNGITGRRIVQCISSSNYNVVLGNTGLDRERQN